MFRSSVPAVYPSLGSHFHRRRGFGRGRLLHLDAFETKTVVHRMSEILFAAEIAFCRLNRSMSQQELNLLDLATTAVTQLRTRSSQVVRCNVFQACPLAASLNDIPHNVLG